MWSKGLHVEAAWIGISGQPLRDNLGCGEAASSRGIISAVARCCRSCWLRLCKCSSLMSFYDYCAASTVVRQDFLRALAGPRWFRFAVFSCGPLVSAPVGFGGCGPENAQAVCRKPSSCARGAPPNWLGCPRSRKPGWLCPDCGTDFVRSGGVPACWSSCAAAPQDTDWFFSSGASSPVEHLCTEWFSP